MTLVPMTDPFGSVEESAIKLLADSAAWRTWTGQTTQEKAMEYIFFSDGEASELPNPTAVVFSDSEFSWESDSVGAGCNFPPSPKGTIQITFLADIPDAYLVDVHLKTSVDNWQIADRQGAERWFKNQCGHVIKGMAANAGGSGYLIVNKFSVKTPISISDCASGEVKPIAMMTWALEV